MATVTGITATAAQAILDGTVESAAVNMSGHLILTLHDTSTIDAGSVIGPTGATGATGASGATLDLHALTVANPTTAAWSNNSKKIQGVTAGASAGDAAIIDQVCLSDGKTFAKAIAGAVSNLTFGTSIAVDCSLGNDFRLTLTASTGVLANPTNLADGEKFVVWVTQDSTGSRTMTHGTNYKFTTALPAPTLSTAANAVDLLMFVYNAAIGKVIFVSFLAGVG